MPVAYIDIPAGLNDGARKKIFTEMYEAIHEAWPIPDTRVLIREWANEAVSQDGRIENVPMRPICTLAVPRASSPRQSSDWSGKSAIPSARLAAGKSRRSACQAERRSTTTGCSRSSGSSRSTRWRSATSSPPRIPWCSRTCPRGNDLARRLEGRPLALPARQQIQRRRSRRPANMQPSGPNIFSLSHKRRESRLDPISGAPAPKEPQIFGRRSLDRGLCDRLVYASPRRLRTHSSAAGNTLIGGVLEHLPGDRGLDVGGALGDRETTPRSSPSRSITTPPPGPSTGSSPAPTSTTS
jgi:hypothetical protein